MSVTVQPLSVGRAGASRFGLRLALAFAALAAVAGAAAALASAIGPEIPRSAPRSPFGAGLREAAPSAQGLGAWLLALQGAFSRSLQAAVLALKSDGAAFSTLTGLGFAYGVFHAAGAGHGKAVIAAYLVSSERALLKGLGMSLAAALLQALGTATLQGRTRAAYAGSTCRPISSTRVRAELTTAGPAAIRTLFMSAAERVAQWAPNREPSSARTRQDTDPGRGGPLSAPQGWLSGAGGRSPITCFHLTMAASARARFVDSDAF